MPSFYPSIGILLAIGLIVYVKPLYTKLRVLYACALITFIFAAGMMIYQNSEFGEVRYYFYKALHAVILLTIVLIAAICRLAIYYALNNRPKNINAAVHSLLIILSVGVIAGMSFVNIKSTQFDEYYHKQVYGITPEQAGPMVDLITQNPINGLRYAPIGSCDRGYDIRAVLLASALAYTPEAYTEPAVVVELTSSDEKLIYWQISLFVDRHHKDLYVISRAQYLNEGLLKYLGEARAKYVHIVDVDPDPPATWAADCPGRLGKPIN
jgi:hypothetical protein